MRIHHALAGLAALAAASALAAPARAQTLNFGGVDPTQRVNVPVTIPNMNQPSSTGFSGFSLTNFLPHFSLPLGNIVHGQSTFPSPKDMPGKAYLQNFGYQRPQPIQ